MKVIQVKMMYLIAPRSPKLAFIVLFTILIYSLCVFGENSNYVLPPLEHMTTPELIENAGFNSETHYVKTVDGYILQVHRIANYGKPPVFLQHGLLCSSADWVINNVNESLGFMLAKKGYDVWLGNFRGNTYSRQHVKLSPDEKEFWFFSWDEMADYDLPAMIDHVLKSTTSNSLYYVGHSMGTTTAFALLSSKPEFNKKIHMFFALAPVVTVGHMKSPIHYLSEILPEVEFFVKIFNIYEFFPQSKIMDLLSDLFCKDLPSKELCADSIFLLCGFDSQQLNKTRMPVYFGHTPAGTSTRTVLHYAQMVLSKNFTKYDFGAVENLKRYHQIKPPKYPLQNVTTSTILFWGLNDWLADPQDVKQLASNIKQALVKSIQIQFKKWSHLDFIWAIEANKYVYDHILEKIAIDIRKEK